MHGTPEVPFLELVRDTIAVHGPAWAATYYRRHGMPAWEWCFWCAHVYNQPCIAL